MNQEGPSNPRVTIAVTRQLNLLRAKAPSGVTLILNDADIFDIQAELEGPVQTPYQGGVFRCKLSLPHDFPKCPPKGYFLTKIFHPNVSEKGEICVNTLKKDWNPQNWSFYNIFEVVKCLLIIPFPESALNEEAGKLFMEDYDSYFKYAKLLTDVHAKPKVSSNKMEIEKNTTPVKIQKEAKDSQDSSSIAFSTPNNTKMDESSEKDQQNRMKIHTKEQIASTTSTIQQQQSSISSSFSSMPHNSQGQLPLQQQQLASIPQQGSSYQQQSSNQISQLPQIAQNSPFRDTIPNPTKPSLNAQKSQNQENLQCQPNFGFAGITLTYEEPLCVLSKNNGYVQNTQVPAGSQGQLKQLQQSSQQQQFYPSQPFQQLSNQNQQSQQLQSQQQQQYQFQQQQQQTKNEILMKLTFNNPIPQITSLNPPQSTGKLQNEKKKWLKRI